MSLRRLSWPAPVGGFAPGRPPGYTAPMRHWLFHPLLFYPLAALLAVALVAISIRPQSWPKQPAPAAGSMQGQTIVLEGAAFDAPAIGAEQDMTVKRDYWGRALSLMIAQKPGQPAPILLTGERAAMLEGNPVTVEVNYLPLPINAASGLAVSVQGIGPAEWVSQPTPPQPGALRFELPPQIAVDAIGLRALSDGTDQAYGLEITRVSVSVAAPQREAPVEPPPGN
ncbi:MAG: hypothetical protein ABL883_14905 [Terricaulis sp.]